MGPVVEESQRVRIKTTEQPTDVFPLVETERTSPAPGLVHLLISLPPWSNKVSCFLNFHDMVPPLQMKTRSPRDLLSVLSFAQSESV